MKLNDDDDDWDWEPEPIAPPTFVVYEQKNNPDHQGFIGFIRPRHLQETKTKKRKKKKR